MTTIFKYPLPAPGDDDLDRETIAGRVVHVGIDPAGVACACILGDPEGPRRLRNWMVVGTGWAVPDDTVHRGTWIHGVHVWHLLEEAQ